MLLHQFCGGELRCGDLHCAGTELLGERVAVIVVVSAASPEEGSVGWRGLGGAVAGALLEEGLFALSTYDTHHPSTSDGLDVGRFWGVCVHSREGGGRE